MTIINQTAMSILIMGDPMVLVLHTLKGLVTVSQDAIGIVALGIHGFVGV